MSKESLNRIINSRLFYVKTYRRAGIALICSVSINLIICLAIVWVHVHCPARQFYASSGSAPPTRLVPLDQPNMKPTPILGAASEED